MFAVAMDCRGPSFRKDLDVRYKATRQAAPADLAQQMSRVEQIERAYNIPIFQAEKIEARLFVIYESGAYQWNNPTALGWKFSPKINAFHLEYMTQNRTRRHIDR